MTVLSTTITAFPATPPGWQQWVYSGVTIVPSRGKAISLPTAGVPSVKGWAQWAYNGGTFAPARGGSAINTSSKFYWAGHNT